MSWAGLAAAAVRAGGRGLAVGGYPSGVYVLGEAVAYVQEGGYFGAGVAELEELLHLPGFGGSGGGEDFGGGHTVLALCVLV